MPISDRSGAAHSVNFGATRDQPCGLKFLPSKLGPMCRVNSRMTDRMVEAMMPMRMAPLTLRTSRPMVRMSPKTNTRVGQRRSLPSKPRPTGTVVPAASGIRRTKPALTSPIRAMNRPMPTTMAVLRPSGTALNTAVRKPVSTRISMVMPERTTSPIMSGQVRPGLVATVTATKALTPRPVAIAKGCLAHAPIRMVRMPATNAVTAATAGKPRVAPAESGPERIRGFSTTM
ncbi:hypothetical protein FQZ97_947360 [compost metagenome]